MLGGMFVPLALYPEWLRALALWLPFSAMIAGPGSMVLTLDPALFLLVAVKLAACAVLAFHALQVAFERALRRLTRERRLMMKTPALSCRRCCATSLKSQRRAPRRVPDAGRVHGAQQPAVPDDLVDPVRALRRRSAATG